MSSTITCFSYPFSSERLTSTCCDDSFTFTCILLTASPCNRWACYILLLKISIISLLKFMYRIRQYISPRKKGSICWNTRLHFDCKSGKLCKKQEDCFGTSFTSHPCVEIQEFYFICITYVIGLLGTHNWLFSSVVLWFVLSLSNEYSC